jgi:hypothetical protein
MNEVKTTGQLALFQAGSVIDEEISRVFGPKQIVNAKQKVVGTAVALRSRKEIAEALNLSGKDNKEDLDNAILAQSDAAWLKVKGAIAALNGEWTLRKFANRTLGNGVEQITVVTQRIRRDKVIAEGDLVNALANMTDEQIMKLVDAAAAKQKEKDATEVQSTSSPAPATAAKEVAS